MRRVGEGVSEAEGSARGYAGEVEVLPKDGCTWRLRTLLFGVYKLGKDGCGITTVKLLESALWLRDRRTRSGGCWSGLVGRVDCERVMRRVGVEPKFRSVEGRD